LQNGATPEGGRGLALGLGGVRGGWGGGGGRGAWDFPAWLGSSQRAPQLRGRCRGVLICDVYGRVGASVCGWVVRWILGGCAGRAWSVWMCCLGCGGVEEVGKRARIKGSPAAEAAGGLAVQAVRLQPRWTARGGPRRVQRLHGWPIHGDQRPSERHGRGTAWEPNGVLEGGDGCCWKKGRGSRLGRAHRQGTLRATLGYGTSGTW
jgi:hypothetical protein